MYILQRCIIHPRLAKIVGYNCENAHGGYYKLTTTNMAVMARSILQHPCALRLGCQSQTRMEQT